MVTNPATVTVTDPGEVSTTALNGRLRTTIPAGVTPVVGQPWILPPAPGIGTGYLGTVVALAADGRSATLAPAGLADVFDYADLEVPDLGAGIDTLGGRRARGREAAPDAVVSCGGGGSERYTIDPTFDPFGRFSAKLAKYKVLGKSIPKGMSFDAEVGVELGLSATAQVTAGASCELDLPSVQMAFAIGPVPMLFLVEPSVGGSVSGSLDVRGLGFTARLGASFDGYLGIGDDELDGDLIADGDLSDPVVSDVSGSLSLGAGVSATLGIGSSNKKAGAVIGLTATLTPLEVSAAPYPGGGTCLEIVASRSADIVVEARAWLGSWDLSRSVAVPGLDGSSEYAGSPWRVPSGCGGPAEYRIAEGTLGVDWSWSASCSNDQGACDDGPDYTSTFTSSETSSARLHVADPGEWGTQYDDYPTYLTAPMAFDSWSMDATTTHRQSGYGCSWTSTDETVGPVQFGGAYWESAVQVQAGSEAPQVDLGDYYYWGSENPEEWTSGWWYSLGAWDTDFSNEYPRIRARSSWASGGDCEGTDSYEWDVNLEWLTPGYWWSWPEESRRSSRSSVATELEGCTDEICRWRVDGSDTHQYRSDYADWGYSGSGAATVTWSYVIERRALE
ncbi:hypothetical protein [Nocardioides sambongensis]|uniref:hypothetical protein n=1 Tax=Nocardioides sambongensis TaxID=2589074 RepID=UPI00112A17EC|nr:hypothetical protein [Nocardioides sambongensis]